MNIHNHMVSHMFTYPKGIHSFRYFLDANSFVFCSCMYASLLQVETKHQTLVGNAGALGCRCRVVWGHQADEPPWFISALSVTRLFLVAIQTVPGGHWESRRLVETKHQTLVGKAGALGCRCTVVWGHQADEPPRVILALSICYNPITLCLFRRFWDDWMRHPDQRQERACIRPEISRTSTFGKVGVSK